MSGTTLVFVLLGQVIAVWPLPPHMRPHDCDRQRQELENYTVMQFELRGPVINGHRREDGRYACVSGRRPRLGDRM